MSLVRFKNWSWWNICNIYTTVLRVKLLNNRTRGEQIIYKQIYACGIHWHMVI